MMAARWPPHQPAYLAELVERHGLPILALHPPIYAGAWRLGREETLVRSARLAHRVSCPLVVAHPPPPRPPPPPAPRRGAPRVARRMGPRSCTPGWPPGSLAPSPSPPRRPPAPRCAAGRRDRSRRPG